MRVAAIYDIHGNLPALEAVLQEVREAGVDQVIVGGDTVPGPMPRETLRCLRSLEVPTRFIHGNGEVAVLAEMSGAEHTVDLPEHVQEVIRWTAAQLGPEHEEWFAGWPGTVRVAIPGVGEVLFCHATPRNENEIFTRRTPEERLVPVFEGVEASTVVCGHTHMQFDRTVGGLRVVNAGSVGMPFGEPGAFWLLLGPGVELRRTSYALEDTAKEIRGTSYPRATELSQGLVRPRPEEEMLELFSKAELT